jgi:hypothetical protein
MHVSLKQPVYLRRRPLCGGFLPIPGSRSERFCGGRWAKIAEAMDQYAGISGEFGASKDRDD